MTEMEYKQACANMTAEQLLSELYKAEEAVNIVYPLTEEVVDLQTKKESDVNRLAIEEPATKIKTIITVVAGVGAVLFFALSSMGGFLGFLLKLLALFCAVFFVVAAITVVIAWLSVKSLKEAIPIDESRLTEANAKLEQTVTQYTHELAIVSWICPKECFINPVYIRKFISFFEDGRADNLKEALNLFDEYLHRLRMEEMAESQLAEATATRIATENAAIAAEAAASAAREAKHSADRAAFNTLINK